MPHHNFRPDNVSWMRMHRIFSHVDAPFEEAFHTGDRGVIPRLSADPEVKVLRLNVSAFGRSSALFKVKGWGQKKGKRSRRRAFVLVDDFEDGPVGIFVKAYSTGGLLRAVLKCQPMDPDGELPYPSDEELAAENEAEQARLDAEQAGPEAEGEDPAGGRGGEPGPLPSR